MAEATKSNVDLKALIAREISLAEDGRSQASKKLTKALQYYQGEMKDVVAETGRSQAVSRDVADVMGWMLPGIIRVFSASDHMAIAEPVGREDEEQAAQATDSLNYTFWKENDGYRIIYNATWDSLIGANAIIKTYWDVITKYDISFHSGLDDQALAKLTDDDDVEVLQHTPTTVQVEDPAGGEPISMAVHEVKIRRKVTLGKTCLDVIPPEDYGKDTESRTCEEARFQYHRSRKSRSELVEMGFDRAIVDTLAKASDKETAEEIARNHQGENDDGDKSMEVVDLFECYVQVDRDGDGIAELWQVFYAGNSGGGVILSEEEWEDENPFDDIPCNPMPHRWEAQSIADETMDVQRIKTVLTRQSLDNIYATNNPQRFVTGDISNPEELFSPSFGGAVFGKIGSTVTPLTVPFVANHTQEALGYQDQVIERRTGVSRSTMALDPEALQNQTATAVQNSRDAAYSQIELVARNMAELGWKKVFRKMLRMEIKHQDKPRTIRLRGEAIDVNPRFWNADMDISINVGLGTGSRDRDFAMLQNVLGNQVMLSDRLAQGGFPDKALEMLPYVMTTLQKSAEAAGIKSPETFYPKVDQNMVDEGKQRLAEMAKEPDPKIKLEQEKLAMEVEKSKVDMQMDAQKNEQDIMLQREKMQGEMQIKMAQLQAEMQLKREQLAAELQLKRELSMQEMDIKREQGFYQADTNAEVGKYKADASSKVSMGGEPG